MRRLMGVLALLAMLWAPVRVGAQEASDEVTALSREVDQLFQAGRFADAIPIAQRALAMLKVQYPEDDFHNAILLKRVAEMYARQGRYGDAEPFRKTGARGR